MSGDTTQLNHNMSGDSTIVTDDAQPAEDNLFVQQTEINAITQHVEPDVLPSFQDLGGICEFCNNKTYGHEDDDNHSENTGLYCPCMTGF